MLYSYFQLRNLSFDAHQVPLSRYLYKYLNRRKEIKKLKAHEKHFLFDNMYILKDEEGEKSFDLSTIEEASDYYFNKLILIYSDNLNFNRPTKDPFGVDIDVHTMEKHKAFFYNYYAKWIRLLDEKKGKYLNVLQTELYRKQNRLFLLYENGEVIENDYSYQRRYLNVLAFYIYYKVKLFFDGITEKHVQLNVSGELVVINIYSYIHTLFRHYFPSLDIRVADRSLNDPIPFLDIEFFPFSMWEFLKLFFEYDPTPLTPEREFLLFSYMGCKYIIWLQYKKVEELNYNFGFEFRTLYKCQEQRDLDKFIGLTEHEIIEFLTIYY